MLFSYSQQVRRFCADKRVEILNEQDVIEYVNRARREVAMRSQCIRIIPPISGAIISANVNGGGSNYTNPQVSITPPDFPNGYPPLPNGAQATASATAIGGTISNVDIIYGGDGYFQPLITITDPTGSGASVTPVMSFISQQNQGQQLYRFRDVDLSMFPGIKSILNVLSVSIIYANYRYSLPQYSFTVFQSMVRQYPFQYQYVPAFCCQHGQGDDGSILTYPIASQPYQMEWDCFCLPSDMVGDTDYEPIPGPWTDAVPYFAAHLAYLEMQNRNAAREMFDLYERMMVKFTTAARPGRMVNAYGRY